jgi:hypothetical protein
VYLKGLQRGMAPLKHARKIIHLPWFIEKTFPNNKNLNYFTSDPVVIAVHR